MDSDPPDRHRVTADAPPAHWPARTRRLVDEIRGLCRDWLSEPLRLCLGDFDRALHERAASARSHLDQQRYQATRQRLVQERQAFEQRFLECIDRSLARLGAPASAGKAAPARLTLSLLDPLEHEMTAAMDQLVARSEARGGPLLVELSYRLAVLVGAPPLESDAMPLGPQAMVRAFRDSSAALGLPAEHLLLLLQAVEGKLIQGLTPLHEMVNNHLAAAGILPRLRPFPLPRTARQPRRQRPLPPAPTPESAVPPRDAAGLRALLARQRGPRPVPDHVRLATADELQTALAGLQHPPGRAAKAGLLRHAPRLREALVDQLNAGRPIDAVPIVPAPEADDALELIVRLFDTLHRQTPPAAPVHDLLDRVQLPMLRAAIIDDVFFERREHPARRLLEHLIDATRDWLDGEDRSLLAPLEQWLDRLEREPPGTALHAELGAALERQVAQLQGKAQAAERRHIEAMQGRERLEQARQRAAELLGGLLAKAPPRAALRALLEHAWSDVLALTLLRHGEQSETFARRLVITDQLLGRLPPGNLETLQAEVEAGLQQIGMHGEEATSVAQRLIGAGAVLHEAEASGLALRLKAARSSGDSAPPAQATPAAPTAEALRLHQRLSRHPGGWFEFTAADGSRSRRKLAWYSARAARGLFVTRQGQRAEEMSLTELAEAIALGKVRELPAANESDLDRAWRTLAEGLRQASPLPGARS